MRAYERLLNYVKINTNADEKNSNCPSSENQWVLAKQLVTELHQLGISNAIVDDNCYVYAKIPAKGKIENNYKIGFIAHMDTSPACPGGPVNTEIITNYNGSTIALKNGIRILPEEYAFLNDLIGQDIIVTDGESLLGADNKAGISIIMTLAERLMQANAPDHCEVYIGFTPDEEIGRGADLFDLKVFDADFAYTIDGGALGEIEFENFNAASANITIHGVNIHPGSAKNKMKNAARLAAKFDALLPEFQRPEYTEGYEGFFHLCNIEGNEEEARLDYIIRDHDTSLFEQKKLILQNICSFMNQQYGDGTIELQINNSYFNMKEKVLEKPEVLTIAENAYKNCNVTPYYKAIRGGTDGSRLSFMGLVCPNLSTGGYNFHSRKELVSIQAMDAMVEILLNIVQ